MNAKVSASKIDTLLKALIQSSGLCLTYHLAHSRTETAPHVLVEFGGPDSAMLLAHDAELLTALQHLTAETLRLEPEEHGLINFEVASPKARRRAA